MSSGLIPVMAHVRRYCWQAPKEHFAPLMRPFIPFCEGNHSFSFFARMSIGTADTSVIHMLWRQNSCCSCRCSSQCCPHPFNADWEWDCKFIDYAMLIPNILASRSRELISQACVVNPTSQSRLRMFFFFLSGEFTWHAWARQVYARTFEESHWSQCRASHRTDPWNPWKSWWSVMVFLVDFPCISARPWSAYPRWKLDPSFLDVWSKSKTKDVHVVLLPLAPWHKGIWLKGSKAMVLKR